MAEKELIEFVKKMKFKRALVGGFTEESVWANIKALTAKYIELNREQELKHEGAIEALRGGDASHD